MPLTYKLKKILLTKEGGGGRRRKKEREQNIIVGKWHLILGARHQTHS